MAPRCLAASPWVAGASAVGCLQVGLLCARGWQPPLPEKHDGPG